MDNAELSWIVNIIWDKLNTRIDHDKAMARVMTELFSDHTELSKYFSDNPGFRK